MKQTAIFNKIHRHRQYNNETARLLYKTSLSLWYKYYNKVLYTIIIHYCINVAIKEGCAIYVIHVRCSMNPIVHLDTFKINVSSNLIDCESFLCTEWPGAAFRQQAIPKELTK